MSPKAKGDLLESIQGRTLLNFKSKKKPTPGRTEPASAMKYYSECNTFHVAVINILKYKCVIWNCFPKSGHICLVIRL